MLRWFFINRNGGERLGQKVLFTGFWGEIYSPTSKFNFSKEPGTNALYEAQININDAKQTLKDQLILNLFAKIGNIHNISYVSVHRHHHL